MVLFWLGSTHFHPYLHAAKKISSHPSARAFPFSPTVECTAPSNAKHAHPAYDSGHAHTASPSSTRPVPPAPPPHPVGRRRGGSRRSHGGTSSMRRCLSCSGSSCTRSSGPRCTTHESRQRMLRLRSEGEDISGVHRSGN
jgi:hypothetical protein